MKRFIVHVVLALTFPVLFFGGNMVVNYYIYSSQPAAIKQTRVLIAGSSRAQRCINPELFSSAQNIAQTAEFYLLTYWKLKKIFETYQPDTLVLDFAPPNIAEFNDYKFSNEKWSIEMFKRSYPIQNLESVENEIPVDYAGFYKTLWKQTAFYPKKVHQPYLGKYSNSKHSDVSDWPSAIRRHFYWSDQEVGVSEVAVNHLDSIVTICEKLDIELVLVNSPVTNEYFENIPPSVMARYNAIKDQYLTKTIFIDKPQDPTYPDSLFLDADHLNEYGANRFTSEIVNHLKNISRSQSNDLYANRREAAQ